jgi:hypothetical protein
MLNFLPWPLYVLVMFSVVMYAFLFTIKSVKDYSNTAIIGFLILDAGGLLVAIHKLAENTGILKHYLPMLEILVTLSFITSIPFIYIGCCKREKDDKKKKRKMLILFWSSLCVIIPLILVM